MSLTSERSFPPETCDRRVGGTPPQVYKSCLAGQWQNLETFTSERSSVAEYELPKLGMGVRFPSLAPFCSALQRDIAGRATQELLNNGGSAKPYQSFRIEWRSRPFFFALQQVITGRATKKFAVFIAAFITLSLAGCAASRHSIPETTPVITGGVRYPTVTFTKGPFIWPVRGDVVVGFGAAGKTRSKGIDIKTYESAPVLAAKSGRIVYCDSRLKGFGNTIIIDHGGGLQTVYAYNSEILVKLGDAVEQGSVIAKAGSTGRSNGASLHFEVRKNSEPQNPLNYLP